ncbi:MAG TPA: hypothetical protein PK403_14675 [Plasticicumulans sp.]|nr:hypothetical protein [Plasticicumulans sp.]
MFSGIEGSSGAGPAIRRSSGSGFAGKSADALLPDTAASTLHRGLQEIG